MDALLRCRLLLRRLRDLILRVPGRIRDPLVTVLFLVTAYGTGCLLVYFTNNEHNASLIFVLAVAVISCLTTGYRYGILASVISAFCINYFFMYPYSAFSFSYTGYPVTMLSMVAVSCLICALTARIKHQAVEAVRREKNTKVLYELNERLNEEKAAIELQSARELIRSDILRAVSHDLRTPLTSISGAASVLLASPDMSPKNTAMLQDIKCDADALIAMVENLLSVTRIQDGTLPLKKEAEMLEEVAGDAVLTIRRRFPACHISLDLPDDILCPPMDAMLIKQVMVNLLENAVRHSGDLEHICLRLFRQDEWAMVEVRDHGKGLTPEVCQAVRAGRPLERNLSGDSTRGMGIGLSVCQSIIKAHGGFVAAGNHPEGGAVFRFGLPLEEATDE